MDVSRKVATYIAASMSAAVTPFKEVAPNRNYLKLLNYAQPCFQTTSNKEILSFLWFYYLKLTTDLTWLMKKIPNSLSKYAHISVPASNLSSKSCIPTWFISPQKDLFTQFKTCTQTFFIAKKLCTFKLSYNSLV